VSLKIGSDIRPFEKTEIKAVSCKLVASLFNFQVKCWRKKKKSMKIPKGG